MRPPDEPGSWRLQIEHRTGYRYDHAVAASYNEARLTPGTDHRQVTLDASVEVFPPAQLLRYWDYWGTQVTAFDVHTEHDELTVTGRSLVETSAPSQPPAGFDLATLADPALRDSMDEYLQPTHYVPADSELAGLAAGLVAGADGAEAVLAIGEWVHSNVRYQPGATAVQTSAVEAWQAGAGVCQDLAHLSLVLLRAAGIPARYVSGYLHPAHDAEAGRTVAGESHAWVEAWIGEWWGYDATNLEPIGERHVAVARGRDYADVAPLRGIYTGTSTSSLRVEVLITRRR